MAKFIEICETDKGQVIITLPPAKRNMKPLKIINSEGNIITIEQSSKETITLREGEKYETRQKRRAD